VTDELSGGSLGADIALRDTTLPTYQATLDEFASQLSNRFADQGLNLFSRADGSLPTSSAPPTQTGYVGYASEIQINPAVAQDPSLVRDGTQAVAGSPTGASAFTPNPSGGPAGFDTLITRVLDYALGSQVQDGVAQPAVATTGLGASGTLSAGFAAPADLGDYASSLVASQAADASAASTQATSDAAVQTSLQSSLSAATGVNIDTELATMTQLQNAYGANAQVIAAANAMWNTLITALQTA
jgi:flagellar hook-associated protein 1